MFLTGLSRSQLCNMLNLRFNAIGWEMAYDMQ